MLNLENNLSLTIIVDNDYELPMERMVFNSLQLSSNVMLHVPQGKLIFADREGLMKKYPLGDGQSIRFIFRLPSTDAQGTDVVIRMRIFRVTEARVQSLDYFTVLMTFDAPRFLNENSTSAINSTSVGALRQIAQESNLLFSYNGNQTKSDSNDKQVWLPRGDKRCVFVNKIIEAAWVSETSCFQATVDLDGYLYYANLTDPLLVKQQRYVFAPRSIPARSDEVVLKCLDLRPFSKSGLTNATTGYKMTTVEQNPTLGKSSNQTKHTKVAAAVTTDSVAMNSNINDSIKGSNTRFAPINCGNTHKNYDKALHQNARLLSLFSVGLHIVTDDFSPDLHLLDYVRVDTPKFTTGQQTYDEATAGFYVVSGKSWIINDNGKFYAKYEMVRQGTNNMKSSSQVGIV